MSSTAKQTILVGVTDSIAAYKAADLVSRLTREGHNVFVIMTEEAQQFITPLTLQTLSRNPVATGLQPQTEGWRPAHIELADRADLLLIAPATANTIAQLAHGLAGNALTEIALATVAPLLIAPAMNGKMWLNPATQENVATLKARGARFIGPEEGLLACGYEGLGRLWNVEGIVSETLAFLNQRSLT